MPRKANAKKATQDVQPSRDVFAGLRAQQALRLAIEGHDYNEIARRAGYSNRGTAWRAVQRELQRSIKPAADELRTLEAQRLDVLLQIQMEKALNGNDWAVDRVLRIMERRAGLLGLDIHDTASVTIPRGKRIVIEDAEQVPLPPGMTVDAVA